MDVEFIVLNDVSCSLTHLKQKKKWMLSTVLPGTVWRTRDSGPNTNPWIFFFFISHHVQDLQESEGRVQETGENSLLYRRNAHLVHLKQIHHHSLVQLDQPLEDSGLKRRPPVSWCKYQDQTFREKKERWKADIFKEIVGSFLALKKNKQKHSSSYLALSMEPLSDWGVIWQTG